MKRKPGWNRSKKTGRFITKAAFNRWYKKGVKRGPQKRRKVKAKEKYIEFEIAIQYTTGRTQGGFEITVKASSSTKPRKRPGIAHAKRNPRSNPKRSRARKVKPPSSHKTASNRLGKRMVERKRRTQRTHELSRSNSVPKIKHKSSRRKSKRNPSRRSS